MRLRCRESPVFLDYGWKVSVLDMTNDAFFQVDPRLTSLLGENYRSTEKALKELIDNAWDANAENVWITLPDLWEEQPIIIRDDGAGMTEREVREEYLAIASPRASRKGRKTPGKSRSVKGRKGIGKFAGLVVAGVMRIETSVRGKSTTLEMSKEKILKAAGDLEAVSLPIEAAECEAAAHGTVVTLSSLNSRFNSPSPEKMKELLVLEYGREADFTIYLNDERLASDDLPGESFSAKASLKDAGTVRLRFKVMHEQKGARNAGIVTRVGGKIVGNPGFFGLEEQSDVPVKLRNRIVGEIEADGLEEDVTADWNSFLENSKAYCRVRDFAREKLAEAAEQVCAHEMGLARTRLAKAVFSRMDALPLHRRGAATEAVEGVMRRYFGEKDARIESFCGVVIDALENDEYRSACRELQRANGASDLVAGMESFGRMEVGLLAYQAACRKEFLDSFEKLTQGSQTRDSQILSALSSNLWLLGSEYSQMFCSNATDRIIASYSRKRFSKTRSGHAPALLLAKDAEEYYLLMEFRSASLPLGRDAAAQAMDYRDELSAQLGETELIVFGGAAKVDEDSLGENIRLVDYADLITSARNQQEWIIAESNNGLAKMEE